MARLALGHIFGILRLKQHDFPMNCREMLALLIRPWKNLTWLLIHGDGFSNYGPPASRIVDFVDLSMN